MRRIAAAVRGRFLRFRREIVVVALAVRHPDTPVRLRLAGLGLILYLVWPLDLVPLWIPVAGLLDDLVLVPWGLGLVVKRLPDTARRDAEEGAARFIDRWIARPLRFLVLLLLALVLLWMAILWLVGRVLLG